MEKENSIDSLAKLEIILEDNFFIIINKAAGVYSHKNSLFQSGIAVTELIKDKIEMNTFGKESYLREGIIHRLDKETSGLMICAKNEISLRKMQKLFKKRKVIKKYTTLVDGNLYKGWDEIITTIDKDPKNPLKRIVSKKGLGKEAISFFEVKEIFAKTTLVEVKILTGRTHQVRLHMKHIGHCVVGDHLYTRKFNGKEPLLLCADFLKFQHPFTKKEIEIKLELPDFFAKRLEKERNK